MPKTIATFASDIEAELAKGKLESCGINAFKFKDDCGGMRPHLQLTDGVQLKVADADFETAKEILELECDEYLSQPFPEQDTTYQKIRLLLHRSRGWTLIGFAIIPGWISFPIALIYSFKAFNAYQQSDLKIPSLKNQILRIYLASAFFTALFWGITICYLIM